MLAWDDLRYLLALSRAGSLTRAGRELGVDHTTVARRIEAVEEALGVRLFVRSPAGYGLTSEGLGLLPGVARIEDAVLDLERATSGGDARLTGAVRITVAEAFGSRYLAPRMGALHRAYPGLVVELATAIRILDLARREADVAIRFFRSTQENLVVRKAGVLGSSIYCSRDYVGRAGLPTRETLAQHDRLAVDTDGYLVSAAEAWFARVTAGAPVVFRTNSTSAMLGAALAGLGIAALPCYIGDREPSLQRIPISGEPRSGIWLTVHRDLQHTPRVRVVLDAVAAMVAADAELLSGDVSATAVPTSPTSAPRRPKRPKRAS